MVQVWWLFRTIFFCVTIFGAFANNWISSASMQLTWAHLSEKDRFCSSLQIQKAIINFVYPISSNFAFYVCEQLDHVNELPFVTKLNSFRWKKKFFTANERWASRNENISYMNEFFCLMFIFGWVLGDEHFDIFGRSLNAGKKLEWKRRGNVRFEKLFVVDGIAMRKIPNWNTLQWLPSRFQCFKIENWKNM